jgi:pimeloyl-ACP methyl ester carboxylesterase
MIAHINTGFVKLPDGGHLYYETHGSPQRDPLVLVHGGNMDHRVWNSQVGEFSEKYRVITYDVRGFGQSSAKDKPHQAHRDLLHLLNAIGITQPIHLAGLSLGGRIAIDFALCYPDRVRGLVLLAPGLSGWKWDTTVEWIQRLIAMRKIPDRERARMAVVEAWLASPGMIPAMMQDRLKDVIRKWTTENAMNELSDLIWAGDDPDVMLSPPAIDRLHEIAMPTLLIIGSKDACDMQGIADKIEKCVHGSRRVTCKNIGHIITLEDPENLNREVLNFLLEI